MTENNSKSDGGQAEDLVDFHPLREEASEPKI